MRFLAKVFMIFGCSTIFFGIYLSWERVNPSRLSFQIKKLEYSKRMTAASTPVAFEIPKVAISLPIISAVLTNGNWQTTDKGVSHLASSPIPGEQGNSILYGHNWTNLLGNLVYVKPGNTIVILYSNHTKKTFKIISTAIVSPTQVSILYPSKDTRITVYTCTGFLDSKRFVVVAELVS